MAESYLLKRMFRNAALISGLIEKRHPGREKTGRQVTVSTDLVYDVLRRHEPDHILLQATWADAATGLLDIGRLGDMLCANQGPNRPPAARPRFRRWRCRSCVDIGKEAVAGEAQEDVLREAAEDLAEGGDG